MNKRIFRSLALISLITLVLSTVLSIFLNYRFYENNTQEDMKNLLKVVEYNLSQSQDRLAYLKDLSKINDNIRITYFDKDANPIFDSFVDAKELKNHGDRKEIKGAKEQGNYKSIRYSTTLSTNTLYMASRLDDGSYIRLSSRMSTITGVFLKILPYNIFIAAIIFVLSLFMSKYSTKRILEPLNDYSLNPETVNLDKIPEITPFIKEITAQKNTIADHLVEIKRERDTIRVILENMKEGLLILDSDRTVLVINKKAMKLFECRDPLNKNILYVTRTQQLLEALESCYKGESSSGFFEVEDNIIKYYANPVYFDGEITGSLILLIDETKAIRAERIREEFSANVSHELKTPLTSICGFAELLKNNMVNTKKDKKEIIERIYEESNRLLELIDEIIKISRLEAGVAFAKEEVDLQEISEKVMEHFTPKAKEKKIKLSSQGEAKIEANPTMIWELVSNLTDNAIKYNRENGSVDIEINQVKGGVTISVKDTGIGIAEEDIDRIFERFYRVDKSRFKKLGGTGLGLSIVKHIVKSHGGKLDIESKINEGTKITVFLPEK